MSAAVVAAENGRDDDEFVESAGMHEDAGLWLSPEGMRLRAQLLMLQRTEAVERVDTETDEDAARRLAVETACGLYDDPDADWETIQAKKLQIHTQTNGFLVCPCVNEKERLRNVYNQARDQLLVSRYDRLVTRQFLRDARWLDYTLRRIEMLMRDEAEIRSRIEQLASHEMAPFALVRLQLEMLVAQGTEGTPVHVEEVEREVRFRVIVFDEIAARELLCSEKETDFAAAVKKEDDRHLAEKAAREAFISSEWFERYLVDRDYEAELAPILHEERTVRLHLLTLHLWRVVTEEYAQRDAIVTSEEFARTGRDAQALREYDDDLISWEVRGCLGPQPVPRRPLLVIDFEGSLVRCIADFEQRFAAIFEAERRRRNELLAYQQLLVGAGGVPILPQGGGGGEGEKRSLSAQKRRRRRHRLAQPASMAIQESGTSNHGSTAAAAVGAEDPRVSNEEEMDSGLPTDRSAHLATAGAAEGDELSEDDDLGGEVEEEEDDEGFDSNSRGFLEWRDDATGLVDLYGHIVPRPVPMPVPFISQPSFPALAPSPVAVARPEARDASKFTGTDATTDEGIRGTSSSSTVGTVLQPPLRLVDQVDDARGDADGQAGEEEPPTIEVIDERRRKIAARWL